MFDATLPVAAWKATRSWYIIAPNDRILPPAMEESAAKQLGATTTALLTCHVSILDKPERVAAIIDSEAAQASSAK